MTAGDFCFNSYAVAFGKPHVSASTGKVHMPGEIRRNGPGRLFGIFNRERSLFSWFYWKAYCLTFSGRPTFKSIAGWIHYAAHARANHSRFLGAGGKVSVAPSIEETRHDFSQADLRIAGGRAGGVRLS